MLVEWKYLHKGTTLLNCHMVPILPNFYSSHLVNVTFLSFLMGFFFNLEYYQVSYLANWGVSGNS